MMRAWCGSLMKIDLPESQSYNKSYDPSGWSARSKQKPCATEAPPPHPHGCSSSLHRSQSKKRRDGEENIQGPCPPQYPSFRLPPIPPEKCFEKHSCFNETLLGCLDYHDYSARKYYRVFQNRFDLDIIRRFESSNLCEAYPTATTREFAFKWPECCIMFLFTSVLFVDKNLMLLEIRRLRKNGIRAVVLSPKNGDTKKRLLRMFKETGPLRRINDQGEFYFYI
ncbi:unnamed protein product [Taenia asiatica]|uniref:Uncharacterized protein n=1 Tax=Taenia asiatica TaxID=60517 RepID=A0A0R3W7A2_TAEAS|nr:unnamed protein product [Taenia asiatica]